MPKPYSLHCVAHQLVIAPPPVVVPVPPTEGKGGDGDGDGGEGEGEGGGNGEAVVEKVVDKLLEGCTWLLFDLPLRTCFVNIPHTVTQTDCVPGVRTR